MLAHLRIRSYLGQRCNCVLRNSCCEEVYNFTLFPHRFSANSRAYIIWFSLIYFGISGQHIFRHDARHVKIDALPSYLYKARFLRRSLPVYLSNTADNSGPLCIKLIGSRDEPTYRKYIMQIIIYTPQTRYAVAREIPPPSPTIRLSLLCAFHPFCEFLVRKCWRAYKTRCNSIKPLFRY